MSEFVIHLKCLPFKVTDDDIINFLELSEEEYDEIKRVVRSDGKNSGECFVICDSLASQEKALSQDGQTMEGFSKAIEVFPSNQEKMKQNLVIQSKPIPTRENLNSHKPQKEFWDGIIRMRGLPYESTIKDVEEFFTGIQFMEGGIHFPLNVKGNSTGQAFIQFENYTTANEGMSRNKQSIGGRYIELFRSSNDELRKAMIDELRAKARQNMMSNSYNQAESGNRNEKTINYGGLSLHADTISDSGKSLAAQYHPNGFISGVGYPRIDPAHFQSQMQQSSAGGPIRQQQNGQQNGHPYSRPGQNGSARPPQKERAAPSPFPHIVAMLNLPSKTTSKMIQDFFKPLRCAAINNHGTGLCEVAFKTHEDCLRGMRFHNAYCNRGMINLELRSEAPVKTENSWYSSR